MAVKVIFSIILLWFCITIAAAWTRDLQDSEWRNPGKTENSEKDVTRIIRQSYHQQGGSLDRSPEQRRKQEGNRQQKGHGSMGAHKGKHGARNATGDHQIKEQGYSLMKERGNMEIEYRDFAKGISKQKDKIKNTGLSTVNRSKSKNKHSQRKDFGFSAEDKSSLSRSESREEDEEERNIRRGRKGERMSKGKHSDHSLATERVDRKINKEIHQDSERKGYGISKQRDETRNNGFSKGSKGKSKNKYSERREDVSFKSRNESKEDEDERSVEKGRRGKGTNQSKGKRSKKVKDNQISDYVKGSYSKEWFNTDSQKLAREGRDQGQPKSKDRYQSNVHHRN